MSAADPSNPSYAYTTPSGAQTVARYAMQMSPSANEISTVPELEELAKHANSVWGNKIDHEILGEYLRLSVYHINWE